MVKEYCENCQSLYKGPKTLPVVWSLHIPPRSAMQHSPNGRCCFLAQFGGTCSLRCADSITDSLKVMYRRCLSLKTILSITSASRSRQQREVIYGTPSTRAAPGQGMDSEYGSNSPADTNVLCQRNTAGVSSLFLPFRHFIPSYRQILARTVLSWHDLTQIR